MRNTAAVFKSPLKAPSKNKTIGRSRRKAGPARGTRTAEKTNRKITGSHLEKGRLSVVRVFFFKKDKLLTIEYLCKKNDTKNKGR